MRQPLDDMPDHDVADACAAARMVRDLRQNLSDCEIIVERDEATIINGFYALRDCGAIDLGISRVDEDGLHVQTRRSAGRVA